MFSLAACLVLRLATAGLAVPSPSESAERARRLHVAVRVDLSSVGPLHSDVVVLTGETELSHFTPSISDGKDELSDRISYWTTAFAFTAYLGGTGRQTCSTISTYLLHNLYDHPVQTPYSTLPNLIVRSGRGFSFATSLIYFSVIQSAGNTYLGLCHRWTDSSPARSAARASSCSV